MVAEKVDFEKELNGIEQQTNDSINYIQSLGLKLPNGVLDMAEWMTIKCCAEQHGLTTQVATNWIARGVIPTNCVKDVFELPDLRLAKNQPYR